MNEPQQDIHQHIDAILASVEHYQAEHHSSTPDEPEPSYQHCPTTIIDVYVIEHDQDHDELPIVESTLDTLTQERQDTTTDEEPETTTPTAPSSAPFTHQRTPRSRWYLVALLTLCMLLIGTGGTLALVPLFTPSARITLVTASRHLTTTSTVQLVTQGIADPAKQQLAGRVLPAITMSQQQTSATTGTTREMAQAAHGLITFYNAAPYAQTIEVGTLLTGADGVQIITDQDATIPAAVLPTEGQGTVSAHAAITGPQGNIRGGDVYGACCRLNMFVASGAFHGGQDARTYQSVAPQDITSVDSSLKTSLDQSVQAAFQAQVQPTETLLTPLSCTPKVTPDHRVGEEATHVQVLLEETCTGVVYSTQALTTLATQRATTDANTRLGRGYTTTTGVQTRLMQVHPSQHGACDLQLQSVSVWAYPFTQEQQNSIKVMIVGMSKDKATKTLLHMTGVQSVSITLKNSTTLPTNAQQISILFLQV